MTDLLQLFPAAGAAIIGPAVAGGLSGLLGTEPAIRFGQHRVVAASLQLIDPHIPGDAGANGQFALYAATRRHHGVVRKQHCAYLTVLVASAGTAQQRAVLLPPAEFRRGQKADLPQPAPMVLRVCLVALEPSSRI